MLRTIRALVEHQAAVRPDATYLVAPESGRVMSFGELRSASLRLATWLAGEGIRPGARVALLMHNGYQTCRLFIGAMYGGYCITPLNLLAQPSQLAYVLEHSDAEIVFVAPDQVERLQQAASGMARPPRMVVCAGLGLADGSLGRTPHCGIVPPAAALGIDDSDGTERSTAKSIPANTSTYLEWRLDDAAQWDAWVNGNGAITAGSVSLDAIWFYRAQTSYTVYVYVDDVTHRTQ